MNTLLFIIAYMLALYAGLWAMEGLGLIVPVLT
jgi:hypothetical protein